MAPFTLLFITLISITYHTTNSEYWGCTGDCACDPDITGEVCSLNCNESDVCKGSTLTCGAGRPCTIACTADSACADYAYIAATTATDVSVVCDGNDACKPFLTILCGTGDCSLTCGEGTSCEQIGMVDVSRSTSFTCTNCPPTVANKQFTASPTNQPSATTTESPTNNPTVTTTTANPTRKPTNTPIVAITPTTIIPTNAPTNDPTNTPTNIPTVTPTQTPSNNPTIYPSRNPSVTPSTYPTTTTTTANPTTTTTTTTTAQPTVTPTAKPTPNPTKSPTTNDPTKSPSNDPTVFHPTTIPSTQPTANPTDEPSSPRTADPTQSQTPHPTVIPTQTPTNVEIVTVRPTVQPPVQRTNNPTANPSLPPTMQTTSAMVGTQDINKVYSKAVEEEKSSNLLAVLLSVSISIVVIVAVFVFFWHRYRKSHMDGMTDADKEQHDTLIEMVGNESKGIGYLVRVHYNEKQLDFELNGNESREDNESNDGLGEWDTNTYDELIGAIKKKFSIKDEKFGLHEIVADCPVDIENMADIAASFVDTNKKSIDLVVKTGNDLGAGYNGRKLEASDSDNENESVDCGVAKLLDE